MTDAKVLIRDGETGQLKRVKELSEAEVEEMHGRIERVMDDVHHGRAERSATAPADPYEIAQHEADVLKGRHHDESGYWRQVMEFFGFTWLEPAELDEKVGKQRYIPPSLTAHDRNVFDRYGRDVQNSNLYWVRPHSEGQWRDVVGARRRPHPALRGMAFTMKDLVDMYAEPKAFDEWARGRITIYKHKRLGIRRKRR